MGKNAKPGDRKGGLMARSNNRPSALDRLTQEAMGQGKVLGSQDDPARERTPELWAWLSTVYIGRDHIKQPATLSIRLGVGGVLVSLVDRDLCASIDATCGSLEGAFDAIEAALTSDTPALKSWGRREPHLRKRRAGN